MKKVGMFMSAALIGLVAMSSGAIAASAIAWSPSTSASAESHGYASTEIASLNAINACNNVSNGANDCEVVQSTIIGCIALAEGNGHASWSVVWPTSDAAVAEALNVCGSGCVWKQWACN